MLSGLSHPADPASLSLQALVIVISKKSTVERCILSLREPLHASSINASPPLNACTRLAEHIFRLWSPRSVASGPPDL